ncbi:conserved protein of unknown function [Thauera humireducens]|jgi:hypothetical protein|uniref:DUF4276 family protein n=1 Tax=Thauera humireducens TaxID=1134435 RepID=UPI002467A429|nr:DUF4276 family protein [Thauera humireducens]CAH1745233.1 conserved protein of unknown function [Thauera humireducens]
MLERLIALVEEHSMAVALERLLPRVLRGAEFEVRPFQCKDDLLKRLPERLRGYAHWLPKEYAILVLVDRDDDDCLLIKQRLENIAAEAGLLSKTTAGPERRFQVVNRIVVEELESWFFGDWPAVRAAYPRVPETVPQKAAYRDPDAIRGGTWEQLERILQRAGYFKSGLRKNELARAVSAHMQPERNTSQSFQVFRSALQLTEDWQ